MHHIVFGESAGGTLRLALRRAGRDDEILSFNDDLRFGPIKPPVPIDRALWARAELYFPTQGVAELDETLGRFWDSAWSAPRHVVWFSRRTACEFCGFLEWVSQMGSQSYQVIDLTDVGIPHRTRDGGSRNSNSCWRTESSAVGPSNGNLQLGRAGSQANPYLRLGLNRSPSEDCANSLRKLDQLINWLL
jgi:uncharacterized protein DUF1835